MRATQDPASLAPDAPYAHQWSKSARSGFEVVVEWNCHDDGLAVSGQVRDAASAEAFAFRLSVQPGEPHRTVVILTHPRISSSFVDVTLTLVREDHAVTLSCNLPVSERSYFNGPIGEWFVQASPSAGHSDAGIDAPAEAGDLFPFVWLQPLTRRQADEMTLRFVAFPQTTPSSQWPLYSSLGQDSSSSSKISSAQTFRKGSSVFATGLASLGSSVALMPQVCSQLGDLTGPMTRTELGDWLEVELGLPPGTGLADFLESDQWQSAVPALWQSLFAIALTGTPQDATLAQQVGATLRLGQLMALLAYHMPTTPPLETAHARHLALTARVVFPDVVATQAPSPSLGGGSAKGHWEVLGIGQLQMARHRLLGYAPGELADVVNVMPRERQEISERHLIGSQGHEQERRHGERAADLSEDHCDTSELADTVAEVMAADGLVRNMSNVTPAYDNLNLTLSGAWAGAGARAGWNSTDSARLAQRVTEHAAQRMSDRLTRRRREEWRALREQRRVQLIDNSQHDRLVGLYHWVDRVVRVQLEPLGSRMILSFELAQPAQPWLRQLSDAGAVPLRKPSALPQPAAQQPPYSVVSASNYQALGAQYDLQDLEPPPLPQRTVNATINRVALGDLSLLQVPDGYSVTSGSATLAVADGRHALACSVGNVALPVTTATAEPQLSAAVPACTSTSAGPALIAPPGPGVPALSTSPLTALAGATGAIPITVMTTAPSFAVTVQLQCALTGAPDSSALFLEWQIRTYHRIESAWRQASEHYAAALHGRVEQAAAPHPAQTQRQELQRSCLELLAASPPTDGHLPKDYQPLLEWSQMTWQFSQQPIGKAEAWPQITPSQRPRPVAHDSLHAFVQAQSARVLVPVTPQYEAWLLFLLQFPVPWAGGPADAPVTSSTVLMLEELLVPARAPDDRPAAPHWTLRVPTTLLYLQAGSDLLPREAPLLPVSAGLEAPGHGG